MFEMIWTYNPLDTSASDQGTSKKGFELTSFSIHERLFFWPCGLGGLYSQKFVKASIQVMSGEILKEFKLTTFYIVGKCSKPLSSQVRVCQSFDLQL